MNPNTDKSRIYSRNFAFVCVSTLFFSASFNMLIPELPEYLRTLDGGEYIGLIIFLFTLTAGFSRPFSGKLTDTIGRKPVMLFGLTVCIVCGFLYPILNTVVGFLTLRLIHGFSTGFTPTATSAYISDIVPQHRMGEAISIQSIFFVTGMALGPALGSSIKLHFSYDILFYTSAAMAMLSGILVLYITESLVLPQKFKLSLLKITRSDIIAPEAMAPAIVTVLIYLSFGAILTLIPDWSDHIGFANKGFFFIVFTAASLLVRLAAGKISDKYGRINIIIVGLVILIIGLVTLAYYDHTTGFVIAAALYGIAIGILIPTVNAWTIDLSHPDYRGKAIATMYLALEVGIGMGALCSGFFYLNITERIPIVMYTCAGFGGSALVYALWWRYSNTGLHMKPKITEI